MLRESEDTVKVLRGRSLPPTGGYVRDRAALTMLRGPNPGSIFALEGSALLGRSGEAQVVVADDTLSRRHAAITHDGSAFFIEDLASTNGTYLNGAPVTGRLPLHDGDRIAVGATTLFRFALHDQVEHDAAVRTRELTERDALTGLFNRGYLDDCMSAEVAYARRSGSNLSAMIIDVDHFKHVNDTHGHPVGDRVLQSLADLLTNAVRGEDLLARFGGEEFVILARGVSLEGATTFAERVRRDVQAMLIDLDSGPLQITVSIGVASIGGSQADTAPALFEAADRALYGAKHAGRNRVVTASQPS